MYLTYWGMDRRPFENSHAPELFVPLDSALLALNKLRYALVAELGAACLVGAAGVGKTEILRVALEEMRRTGALTAYCPNPSGDREAVLRPLAQRLGAESEGVGRSALEVILDRLERLGEAGEKVCIVLDDAHRIEDPRLLDDFRTLLNIEQEGRPVVRLVISGQPRVLETLRLASRFDLHMAMRIRMQPLDADECGKYILYRLKVSGCHRGIFTRHAAEEIYRYTQGVPSDINRLCELALVTGFGVGAKKIKPDLVATAAEDLGFSDEDVLERELAAIWGGSAGGGGGAGAASHGGVAGLGDLADPGAYDYGTGLPGIAPVGPGGGAYPERPTEPPEPADLRAARYSQAAATVFGEAEPATAPATARAAAQAAEVAEVEAVAVDQAEPGDDAEGMDDILAALSDDL